MARRRRAPHPVARRAGDRRHRPALRPRPAVGAGALDGRRPGGRPRGHPDRPGAAVGGARLRPPAVRPRNADRGRGPRAAAGVRRGALDELEEDHLGRVRPARAQLEDAGVAALALRVAGGDLLEQLVDDELVLAEAGHRQAAGVAVALLGEGDQPLQLGLDGLGLGLGRLDALVVDHLAAEVHEQRLAVRRVARQLALLLAVAHGRRTLPRLACAQPQAARVEGLLDLLDRLAAEVRDRGQLGLGLLDEVADRLDARPLEAVVRAHAQLELLDQDVVHPAGARRARAVAGQAVGPGDQRRALVAQRLDAVGVGEDRQVLDEDLGGLAQRGLRVERAVGLDVDA